MGSSRSAPSPPTAPSPRCSRPYGSLRSSSALAGRRPHKRLLDVRRREGCEDLVADLSSATSCSTLQRKLLYRGGGGCAGGRNRAEPQKGTPTGYTPQVWQKLGLRPPDTRPSAAAAFPTTSPPLPNLSIAFTLAMEGQKCGSWSLLSGGWR